MKNQDQTASPQNVLGQSTQNLGDIGVLHRRVTDTLGAMLAFRDVALSMSGDIHLV